MKKTILSTILLSFSLYSNAELNDLHFYSQNEHYNKVAMDSILENNPEYLLQLGKMGTKTDQAPIHIAVIDKNLPAIKEIIKYKEYVNVKNSNEQTALMLALKEGSEEIVKMLIEAGASVDDRDKEGNTVSAYAEVGNVDVSRFLKGSQKDVIKIQKQEYSIQSVDKLKILEDNINDIIALIEKNESSINDIKSKKFESIEKFKEASLEINDIKEKLQKQAKILLPIVKNNLSTIKTINQQIKDINEKTIELKNSIKEIDELKNEIVIKLRVIDELKNSFEESKKDINKTNLEKELESINENKNVKKNNEKKIDYNSIINDEEIMELKPINTIFDQDDSDSLLNKIQENIVLLVLFLILLSGLFGLLYIRKNKKEYVNNIDIIESKEQNEEEKENVLDKIKIEENEYKEIDDSDSFVVDEDFFSDKNELTNNEEENDVDFDSLINNDDNKNDSK